MNAEQAQLKQVKAIFEHAIDYESAADRSAYLDRACAGLADVRRQVDALLAAHDSGGDFMDSSPVDQLEPEAPISESEALEWLPNDRIIGGRYRVTNVLAIGGMGVVYEAEQLSPSRRVALKVMRRGMMMRRTQKRFRYEAETLARLVHPNIAQVYDAGVHYFESARDSEDALPYFAMEYVDDARPITGYAQQNMLPTKERLQLFCDACAAIQHGHQRGIVHRDLKPPNVLVDAGGRVKVIDFGVARVTDSDVAVTTMQTGAGEIVGTVQYMSPEQCAGDPGAIDTRTDVYSLGLLLYELLTDSLPYDVNGLSIARAMKRVEEAEPPPLSTVHRRMRGDLEVIVDKALAKRPGNRYQSVSELSDDVRRYLTGDSICARKPSGWIRLTRWMGRHPIWTSAVGAIGVFALIMTALAGTVWYGLVQPSRFSKKQMQGDCTLVSRLGAPVAYFGEPDLWPGNALCQMVMMPKELGGGKVALVLVDKGARSTGGQLCMYKPKHLEQPLWSTSDSSGFHQPDFPDNTAELGRDRGDFTVRVFRVADVFPESPGAEILTLQNHRHSSSNVIRILSAQGTILFEAWHYGFLRDVTWWEEESLLVCDGDRHWRDEVQQYGYEWPDWPIVVFALRPKLGEKLGWVNHYDWPESDQTDAQIMDCVMWYRTLQPATYCSTHTGGSVTGSRIQHDARSIEITYAPRNQEILQGGFTVVLDVHGEMVSCQLDDVFLQLQDEGRYPITPPIFIDWPPPLPPGNAALEEVDPTENDGG
ncbi:MAG: serine/threonine protein kinase [Planctomycetes bacterium]|nr:serine/threonine protein kinase [Planctomycetota bacterium]NOG55612.1 serine/threonine protein kinase [Planctomycetota bacterium]